MFDCHMQEGHVMLIPAPQMLPEQLKESSKKEVQELLKKNNILIVIVIGLSGVGSRGEQLKLK